MAYGRKRCFIGGMLVGFGLMVVSTGFVIYGLGITTGPPGYPHFTEKSAREAALEWARLSPFPAEAQSFTIVTAGNLFTRQFQVAFFGDPKVIEAWVRRCPGIADPRTKKSVAADGTVTYDIAPGDQAAFAEMIHHPVRGTVVVRTYWS